MRPGALTCRAELLTSRGVIPEAVSHRAVCGRCRRPASVCYCAHLVSLETRTRVILLQHPRERQVPIGTARLAHLCLPGSELHVGVDFDDDRQVRDAIAGAGAHRTAGPGAGDGDRPAYLLFPGPQAVDLADALAGARLTGQITLVVVDGTWWQARKLLKRNAVLAALPQLRFTPPAPSRYRIRREPAEHCVATVEALAQVLGALEGEPERFAALLRPFEAMIDTQLRYATQVRGARRRHALHRARRVRRPTASTLLRERARDVVCLHGEANAWPARRPGGHPAEIVHWVARRAQTGETFEAIIAPRRPLAPAIPRHLRIPTETLAAGESWASFSARWAAYLRPDDLICSWGRYPIDVLEGEGGALPAARLDLRPAAGSLLGGRAGSLEDCTARLGVEAPAAFALGRGGTRLAALCGLVDKMMSP
jgi:tRNA-uridine aminocarboxypropyltransferase